MRALCPKVIIAFCSERRHLGYQCLGVSVGHGSIVPVRGQREQSLAEHRCRRAGQPRHPATVERQVPRHNGQLSEELANVGYRRLPTFDSEF
jgi:hypothetical protein